MGQKGRAWSIANSGGDSPAYGHRSKQHYDWFLLLEKEGYTLEDIVRIEAKNLSKKEAFKEETKLLDKYKPTFNKVAGLKNLKITKDQYKLAIKKRNEGSTYDQIGKELNLSTMTIYRAINNQTKNVGEQNV
jgi:hypothetical protein